MVRRFLASALLAGLLAGLAITALQSFTTTPLIAAAEGYEHAAPHAHGQEQAEHEGWLPADGFERLFFTALANVIAGVGFAFVLVACLALWRGKASGRTGVVWGMAGFAVFTLAPSLGLAPYLVDAHQDPDWAELRRAMTEHPGAIGLGLRAGGGAWLDRDALAPIGRGFDLFRSDP